MSVWNQREPLLSKVQKPARYIGCEDGAQAPTHEQHCAAWLLGYPDTHEIVTASRQSSVTSSSWQIEVRGVTPPEVDVAVQRLLDAPTLTVTRQRKGKDVTDDVRPYLLEMSVVGPTLDGTEIEAHLATQPRGLRISELIALLNPEWVEGRVRRTNQWMLLDGARCEPLAGPSVATSAPHAQVRAS